MPVFNRCVMEYACLLHYADGVRFLWVDRRLIILVWKRLVISHLVWVLLIFLRTWETLTTWLDGEMDVIFAVASKLNTIRTKCYLRVVCPSVWETQTTWSCLILTLHCSCRLNMMELRVHLIQKIRVCKLRKETLSWLL